VGSTFGGTAIGGNDVWWDTINRHNISISSTKRILWTYPFNLYNIGYIYSILITLGIPRVSLLIVTTVLIVTLRGNFLWRERSLTVSINYVIGVLYV